MKPAKSWLIPLIGLLLVFMIAGFGSLADSNRGESRKGSAEASGTRQTYLFASPPDGTGLQQLTSDGTNRSPGWSSDESRVALGRCGPQDSANAIYVMNANCSGLQEIGTTVSQQPSPVGGANVCGAPSLNLAPTLPAGT